MVKKSKNHEKDILNMLDLAKNDVYNVKLESYSTKDLEKMIEKYLKGRYLFNSSIDCLFLFK